MIVELHIDTDTITLDDLIMVDELNAGKLAARQLKDFVSRFMWADGAYLPKEQALEAAGKMTISQLREAFEAFSNRVRELQATAVPPALNGSSS